ncbi:MAG TPA: hypothetical protein VND42_03700 [Candidatus Acidoferrales bacterium]|nr:hypothetical protein [Candidatus Acidoferrales bacterium]
MDKSAKAPKPARKTMQRIATPSWRKLPNGVWKTDFGVDLPEVVILTMSNEEFEEFRRSSDNAKKRNLNKRGILKRHLIDVVLQKPKRRKRGKCVLLLIYHTPESTGYLVPFPLC